MSDQERTAELTRQRPAAVEDFVREHQDRVVNTCYGFLHNRQDAEDAAQQVFLKAWQALPGFRGDSKLSTWLYQIAVRTSMDILRRRQRDQRWVKVLCLLGFSEPVTHASPKDPLVEVERRERAKLLMSAIDALPEQQRVAYTLASFERLKGEEIAEVMETTLSAVESLLHRARANLREKLRGYYQSAKDPTDAKNSQEPEFHTKAKEADHG